MNYIIPKHIWLGGSLTDQGMVDEFILLLQAIRPLLAPAPVQTGPEDMTKEQAVTRLTKEGFLDKNGKLSHVYGGDGGDPVDAKAETE